MKEWFDELNVDPGKLQGKNFSVTGYSLGGHLATAFNLLMYEAGQADRIFETYTFNGAGVGEIKNGASLTQAINAFRTGQNSGNTDLFTDSLVRALYASVRSSLSNPAPTQAEIDGAMAQVITAQTTARALPNSQTKILRLAQIDTLLLATKRVRSVFDEAERVKNGIDSGDANSAQAKGVAQSVIAAVKLDYQLGILRAKEMTQAYKSGPVDSFGAAYAADRAPLQLFGLSPIQDIYAAPPPSAVANSQRHYGAPRPVWIEDQPLSRGISTITTALQLPGTMLGFGELKLLRDGFVNNDFGDTHSLVLLVDSLSIQDTFAQLIPSAKQSDIELIHQAASNVKASSTLFSQGKAEGDVLENVLNALSRVFLGLTSTRTIGNLTGGTWARIDERNVFHANLKVLRSAPAFTASIGRLTMIPTAGSSSLAKDARLDFASFLSLLNLAPFVLKAASAADSVIVEAALAMNWGSLSTEWRSDKDAVAAGQQPERYTDVWLADRQALLQWKTLDNFQNADGLLTPQLLRRSISETIVYEDRPSNTRVQVGLTGVTPNAQVTFGGTGSEALVGTYKVDHLYGGAGSDTLRGNGGNDYLEGNADPTRSTATAVTTPCSAAPARTASTAAPTPTPCMGGAGNDILGGADSDTLFGGGRRRPPYGGSGNDSRGRRRQRRLLLLRRLGQGHDRRQRRPWLDPRDRLRHPHWRRRDQDHQRHHGQRRRTGSLHRRSPFRIQCPRHRLPDPPATRSPTPSVSTSGPPAPSASAGWNGQAPGHDRTYVGDFDKQIDGGTYVVTRPQLRQCRPGRQCRRRHHWLDDAGDQLLGLNGNDALAGLDGDDALYGGEGDDFLLGGPGSDTLGGARRDVIFGSGAAPASPRPTPLPSSRGRWHRAHPRLQLGLVVEPRPGRQRLSDPPGARRLTTRPCTTTPI